MKDKVLSAGALKAGVTNATQRDQAAAPLHDSVGAFVPGKRIEWAATGKGVLDGLSCGVKDVFDIAGCTTGYGNPEWEKTHDVPSMDAIAVSKIRRQGAHIVGKTITDELAFSLAGNNYHYGSPVNTAAPDRLTGGSSCGSAAAVAAGLCDIGLGTDTAGSVRAPASFCGIYGFRSTHGLISKDGICTLAQSFDTVGWLTRDARTLAAAGRALLPDMREQEEVSSWSSFDAAWASLDDVVREETASVLGNLKSSLGESTSLGFDLAELDVCMDAFRVVQFYQVWEELGAWIKQAQPVLGPDVRERISAASNITRGEYLAASGVQRNVKLRFESMLKDGRVLVMPTVSAPAPLRNASVAELNRQRQADLRFLCMASLAGLPQVSIPALTVHGAPLGLSIIGAPGTDAALLDLAATLEEQKGMEQARTAFPASGL